MATYYSELMTVVHYATRAAFPTAASNEGPFAFDDSTGTLYIYNSYSGAWVPVGDTEPYPVNYADTATAAIAALIGAPFAPDGTNMTNGQTCLFTGLVAAADRGVYMATVVAGNVTAWTRIVYNSASPTGTSLDGDVIIATAGTAYGEHWFQCTVSSPTSTWVDLGIMTQYWTRTGTVLSPRTIGDSVAIGTTTSTVDLRVARGAANVNEYLECYSAAGDSANLSIIKSHNNTIGTLTQTIDTEIIGGINFIGVDNTSALDTGAAIQVVQDGAAGTKVPVNMVFTTSSNSAANANQLVLHNDGNIGFGTDAPTARVHTDSFAANIVTKTFADTGYNIATDDYCVLVNTNGGDTTVNLPTAVGIEGKIYVVKKIDAANNMTVGSAGGTIDGDASKTYAANYSSITVISDNTNWHII